MYSPASDVWSFGVTVWEVLTYCNAKPFEEMNDDQVRTITIFLFFRVFSYNWAKFR